MLVGPVVTQLPAAVRNAWASLSARARAASTPAAPDRHRRLASRDQRRRSGHRSRASDELARDVAGLALQRARQHVGAIAEPLGLGRRRLHHERVVADDEVSHVLEDLIARLRCLGQVAGGPGLQALDDRGRCSIQDGAALEDGQGVGVGARVRRGGPGGDDVERVADDVREREREHCGWPRRPRQQAALEARDVLAHGIQLVDGGAGGKEQARETLLLFERDRRRRRWCQRRAAAGDEKDDQIVCRGRLRQRQQPSRGGDAARVRHRMAGLGDLDPRRRHPVAVLHDDEPVADAGTEQRLDGGRNRPAGLARAEPEHAAHAVEVDAQFAGSQCALVDLEVPAQQRRDVTGGQRRAPDGRGRLARVRDQ